METPDRQMRDYNGQYDVVIMGKSSRYCYDEWEELYWPFTRMLWEKSQMETNSDDESLFSDNS